MSCSNASRMKYVPSMAHSCGSRLQNCSTAAASSKTAIVVGGVLRTIWSVSAIRLASCGKCGLWTGVSMHTPSTRRRAAVGVTAGASVLLRPMARTWRASRAASHAMRMHMLRGGRDHVWSRLSCGERSFPQGKNIRALRRTGGERTDRHGRARTGTTDTNITPIHQQNQVRRTHS